MTFILSFFLLLKDAVISLGPCVSHPNQYCCSTKNTQNCQNKLTIKIPPVFRGTVWYGNNICRKCSQKVLIRMIVNYQLDRSWQNETPKRRFCIGNILRKPLMALVTSSLWWNQHEETTTTILNTWEENKTWVISGKHGSQQQIGRRI